MTDLCDYFKESIPSSCCRTRCHKPGCKVDLRQAPSPFVLIDMDCGQLEIEEGANRCDFLYVSQGAGDTPGWVAALELKGRPKSSEIVAQLQAGAQFAAKVLAGDVEVRFRPIAFYSGGFRGAEREKLRKASIRFRHPKQGIVLDRKVILRRCGSSLKEALRASG